MTSYIVFNQIRETLRTGFCLDKDILLQAKESEFVMEGTTNDVTQKIEFDGLDDKGQPVNPRVVDKTPEEIERDNPKTKPIPFEKRSAQITNEQWQDVLDRLDKLEIH